MTRRVVVCVAALSAAGVLTASAEPMFDAGRSYYCGDWPRDVAVGDFNGDGHQDLVVPLFEDEEAAVLLGNGDGTFGEATTYETAEDSWDAEKPFSAAVGRLNGDDHDDIVVANWGSNNIGWLLGNGDGTFATADTILIGGGPNCVILADFNEDAILDAVTANWFQDNITIVLGDGTGDFTYPAVVQYDVGSSPYTVAAADLNEDDDLDIVTANFGDDDISVLLGNGDGTFDPAVDYPAGDAPHDISFADFNGDDDLDIVVPNRDGDEVSLFLGNGDGTFQSASTFSTGDRPYSIVAGDFDGDDAADFATACRYDHMVHVFIGDGAGGFAEPVAYSVGVEPYSLALGDFDEDMVPDLAVATREGENVHILTGRGDGTFRDTPRFRSWQNPYGITLGLFDGDANPDLAVTGAWSDTHKIEIFLGHGDGSFSKSVEYPAGDFPTDMAGGHFNGDAYFDLIAITSNDHEANVLLGNGDGTFAAGTPFDTGYPSGIVVADLNGRGGDDLVIPNGGVREISTFTCNGDGTFSAVGSYPTGGASGMTAYNPGVGDFNEDGDVDLAVPMGAYNAGSMAVLLGNGDGSFGTPNEFVTGLNGSGQAAVGHFDDDDHLDVVIPAYSSQHVSVLFGNGDGSFQPPEVLYVGAAPTHAVAADFNEDGYDDFAISVGREAKIVILYSNGDGTFASPDGYSGQESAHDIIAGDIDGDGHLDLLMSDTSSDFISVYVNLLPGTPVEGSFYAVANEEGGVTIRWTVGSLADIRGFRVCRATSPSGPFDPVHEGMLAPDSPGEFIDTTVWPQTRFWYELRAVMLDWTEDSVGQLLASADVGGRLGLSLSPPRPNPSRDGFQLALEIPDGLEPVRLAVYSISGQLVRTLARDLDRGRHALSWDGRDESGRQVASGVYLVRLHMGGSSAERKVAVLR